MTNVSVLNQLPHKLFKPSNISLFASFGIHALFLAYILPHLSLWETDEQGEITVGLTELTAAEQSRLPNLSPSPLESFETLSLPGSSALNTPLPDLSTLDLPSSTALLPPPLPQSDIPPVSSIFPRLPTPALPPPPQVLLPPSRQIPLPELEPIAPDESVAESPTPPSPSAAPPQEQAVQPEASPRLPQLPAYSKVPVLSDQPNRPLSFPPPSPATGARELINQPQESNPAAPSPPERQVAANSDAAPPPLPAQNAVEKQRQQQLVAEILERRQQLRSENTGTTDEDARKNFLSWSSTVEAAQIKPEEITLAGTYPQDACIKKLEGTSVYGILIDAQGKITDHELIKSSGYPLFNEHALKTVKTSSFSNKTDQPKPYLVRVNFNYTPEICPSLGLTPPEPDSQNEQTAPPANAAAPETPPAPETVEEQLPQPAQAPVPPSGAAAEKPQLSPPAARPQPSPSRETTEEAITPSESLGGPIEGVNPFTQPTLESSEETEK